MHVEITVSMCKGVRLNNTFIAYFEKAWIGKRKRIGNKQTKPLYELAVWNCYQTIIDRESRTNNGVED